MANPTDELTRSLRGLTRRFDTFLRRRARGRFWIDRVAMVLIVAAAVWYWWGFDAVLLIVVAPLVASRGVKAVAEILETRAEDGGGDAAQAAWDRLPRLVVVLVILGLIAGRLIPDDEPQQVAMRDAPSSTSSTSATTTTTDPRAVATTYATVPARSADASQCPPERGRRERRVLFDDTPAMCIDPEAQHIAEVTTNYGTFQVALNTRAAPWTVNNFAYLAGWRFYEGARLFVTAPREHIDEDELAVINGESVTVDDPVARDDIDRVPGYSLQFEQGADTYPAGELEPTMVPVVVYDAYHPHRWEVMIANRAVELVDANRDRYPLLGQLQCGLGVFANTGVVDPSAVIPAGAPYVIERVRVHELPGDVELEIAPRSDCASSNRQRQATGMISVDPCCALPDN